MLNFANDYSNGAHPEVLEAIVKSNSVYTAAYGNDVFSERAKEKIKAACGRDCDVYLLVGGTQTNRVVISSILNGYEGVIAADSGHINQHEAGAIEASGHKVLALPHKNGKLDAVSLKEYLEAFYTDESHTHMVFPGMVYISHPSELGTLYTKSELSALRAVCKEYGIPLFLDGARLGYALACEDSDLTLSDIASLCDVFYIGGTKVGALCGEAVVFTNTPPKHFLTSIKQNGAMLAKGRLVGVQFDALFTDDLYMRVSTHAARAADKLRELFATKNYRFFINSPTNQIFVIVENSRLQSLREKVAFTVWAPYDSTHTVLRFVTSWSTTDSDISALGDYL